MVKHALGGNAPWNKVGAPAEVDTSQSRSTWTSTCDSCQDGTTLAVHRILGLRSGNYKGDHVPIHLCRKCAVAIGIALLESEVR